MSAASRRYAPKPLAGEARPPGRRRPPLLRDGGLFRTKAYVNGVWTEADSGATFPVLNPATGETVARVPRPGAPETRRAIEAAARALPGWRRLLARDRARLLGRLADLMTPHPADP